MAAALLIFAVVTLPLTGFEISREIRRRRRFDWPSTEGRLREVTRLGGRPMTLLACEYTVEGTLYRGTTKRRAKAIAPGDALTIRYNPQRPEQSEIR